MELSQTFIELSLIISIAFITVLITNKLNQPSIIGYIVAAILVSPLVFNLVSAEDHLMPFAKVGIALLLFIIGLELNPRIIKQVGKVATITGLGQIAFTFGTGFIIAILLGFSYLVSTYIAIALTFSSTIVVMKLLTDKEEHETLHGKIATGFLIIQDLVHIIAIIFLLALGTVIGGADIMTVAVSTVLKTLFMGGVLLISGMYILPSLTKYIAKYQELLLLFSVGWALIIATAFAGLNLSFEVGALLAGVTLSLSPYRYEITSKVRPFRDFFLLIFFISLSTQIVPLPWKEYLVPILAFSGLVLIGNPLVVMTLMRTMRYTKRNSFLSGLTLAQISEFSLIIIGLGVTAGHLSPEILSMAIIIGLITIAGSSYSIMNSHKIYSKLSPFLTIFEKKGKKIDEGEYSKEKKYETILFGYNRIGYTLLNSLKKTKSKTLVIDYNPNTIKHLSKLGIDSRYGDANDLELLADIPIKKAKTVISTVPDIETNMGIIETTKEINPKAIIIVVSHQIDEAINLYDAGATYVITPHLLGGKHTGNLIEKHKDNKQKFSQEGKKDKKELLERKEEGQFHPNKR